MTYMHISLGLSRNNMSGNIVALDVTTTPQVPAVAPWVVPNILNNYNMSAPNTATYYVRKKSTWPPNYETV
jgi:hypothetical protein